MLGGVPLSRGTALLGYLELVVELPVSL